MATNNSANNVTAASGKVLQGQGIGTASAFSTATYPATATGTGTILRADGTNWVATTSTYPNTNAVSTLLYASSANVMSALATANTAILATNSSGVPSITTASGNWINTSRTAFLAYLASADNNVTGDNTTYTIGTNVAMTVVFDQASDFNTNGTFTAPVGGRYQCNYKVYVNGGTAIDSATAILATSNRSYRVNAPIQPASQSQFVGTINVLADFDAADTATYTISTHDSGGKIDDLPGAATNTQIFMSAYLVC